ncbi:MAG TPA: TldD/PmbA family protein, partial [Croceicoccus sp.]|nr:TldD/PmbA family protein [Croceicoccus sp.]
MLSGVQAQDRCADLIACARKLGADAADTVYVASHSESVQVRLGAL